MKIRRKMNGKVKGVWIKNYPSGKCFAIVQIEKEILSRRRLSIVHERLNNQRKDYLHKLSRFYVNNYDFIVLEDLNIKNMVRKNIL